MSWPIAREDVERLLPAALEPATVDGRYLISVAAMRQEGAPRYRQINIRTYARHEGEDAVYFLLSRVTAPGLVGLLVGAPLAPSRIAVRRGLVEAPGLGISVRYAVGEEIDPGAIGRHELGIFGRRRLRTFRIRRGPAAWRRGELEGRVRADPLQVYGFRTDDPADVLYAEHAPLELESLPSRLHLPARRGKIREP